MPPSKNISFEELSQYFHLPINAVAKELGVCATILKKTCRKNGIPRWPHRKIKSIDNRIANLEVNLEKNPQDRDEIAKEIELLKSKKQEIMRNPDILVKSSKSSDDSSPLSEPPAKQQSSHQPVKHQANIHQSRSAPYAVKTFRAKEEHSGSDADDTPNSQTAPTPNTPQQQQQTRTNETANQYPMHPYFNPQTMYREMMEEPMMSGLNFMSNPASNRITEQANQLALERIIKNHNTKMSNAYVNPHNEYEMPPSQNPYIASPSSLFNDGPASYIQPPAALYNYGTYSSSSSASWSQSQQQPTQPIRAPYPPYNPNSMNVLYQQMLNQRDAYFPPLDLPPQQPPRSTETPNGPEKLSLSEYVTLARASALFANREDVLNHHHHRYQQQQQQQPPSSSSYSAPLNM